MGHREAGYRLLRGAGLEIGAFNAAAQLPGSAKAEYCDAIGRRRASALFPEVSPASLVDVDHVFDVDEEGLSRFESGSRDFVIANFVVDHLANPLRFVAEAFRVVKPGGHVVLSVPDKRFTDDRSRATTDDATMQDAYENGITNASDDSYLQSLTGSHPDLINASPAVRTHAIARARERRESLHAWTSQEFRAFLDRALQKLGVAAECVYERNGDETRLEYFSVWRHSGRQPIEPARGGTISANAPATTDDASPDAASSSHTAPLGEHDAGVGILICGMHRSGTSALARVLKECGAWLGNDDDFLPAHAEDNPEGYWERKDVYEAQVDFLNAHGFHWDKLAGFSAQLMHGIHAQVLRERLRRIVVQLAPHSPWLLKDPRLSLLLPVWLPLAPNLVPVIAVRHPLEIAGSLARSLRGIYPKRHALALWEKYLLRTLKDLDGRPAIFVSYRHLMADPRGETARMIGLLQQSGVNGVRLPDDEAMASLLKSGLHRNQIDGDPEGLLDHRQAELFALIEDASRQDEPVGIDVADWPEPDEELAEFQASYEFRINSHFDAEKAQMTERITNIERLGRSILAGVEAQSSVLREENVRLTQRNEQLASDLSARGDALNDAHVRLRDADSVRSHMEAIERDRHALATRIGEYDRTVHDLKRSLSWRITAPVRWLAGLARVPRIPYRVEHRLYRWYYGFPGVSYERKRSLVEWMHRTFPRLTGSTQSYMLFRQQGAIQKRSQLPREPRMDEKRAAGLIAGLTKRPTFSIVMPVYNTDREWLDAAVQSVRSQYYDNWQLCIVDDHSSKPETLAYLAGLDDPRIVCHRLEENQGIARATNVALTLVKGDYIGLLDHDDVLTRDALLEVALSLQDDEVDLVYSDEDKMDIEGNCHGPVYKPDFSPEYLSSNNYFCHFTVISRDLMEQVGGLRYGYDGAQDFDLVLRLSEQARRVHHIPKVLYHWRMIPSSTAADASAKPYTWEAGRRALNDSLERRGIAGRIDLGPFPNTYHLRRDLLGEPLVSIIIPFRDEPRLLRACVDSILTLSTYRNVELLLVNNQSQRAETHALLDKLQARDDRIRCIDFDEPFNYSALHNFAVPQARGEMLLFLNNDTEVITPDWIECLVEHAQRPEVAVAGCRLLYPDDTVQHAGVIVGIGSFAGHAHHLMRADHPGYMARPHLLQNVSAVTFACAMMRKDVYLELGGLNANELAVAYNDVDFCLRACERGYLIVYTPHAQLYHHESKSRGGEDDDEKRRRFSDETAYMHRRHRQVIESGDPFYNVNFPSDGNSYVIDADYVRTLPV
jgi:glycosyltransferase involved in cell wall biosynthesis/SAM-dependent methyltransferase